MKKLLLLNTLSLLLFSCSSSIDLDKERDKIKQTDIEFSDYSVEHGVNAAFLEYLHPEGVMLRPGSMPIEGVENVTKHYSGDDSSYQLSWEPTFTRISKSGDLGYTYGTYDLLIKATNEHRHGTYVTIWAKDEHGDWKMILDSGNPGLGE